jgi:N-dimethylarginine dimethylaminohydrolase
MKNPETPEITEIENRLGATVSATSIERTSFLMCPPFSHDVGVANNIWMTEYAEGERRVDRNRSLVQFLDLYNFMSAQGLVYLLPAPMTSGLQDQVFVANLAFIPEHLQVQETAIVSKFTSAPRVGEAEYGRNFFQTMGYRVVEAPFRFEGEAEIKHLHDNVYIGGYGERSDRAVYDWMASEFEMKIIQVEQRDAHLYHLDCSIFPLSQEETIVATSLFTPDEIKAIEKVTGIIDVSESQAYSGICNSLRLRNNILNASEIHELKAGDENYAFERDKNRKLEEICADRGYEPVFFNLNEYYKSGALLSCMVMHLNRRSYHVRVI